MKYELNFSSPVEQMFWTGQKLSGVEVFETKLINDE